MTRPAHLIYGVNDVPPPLKLAVLGLQQVTLISIYLVIMVIVVQKAGASPLAARNAVSLAMLALGVGAVLQSRRWGPVGSGNLAPPVLSAIYLQASLAAVSLGGLPLVFGMTVFAGAVEATLARFLHRLRFIFPPAVIGVIVTTVGFEVGLIGIRQVLDVAGQVGSRHFEIHFLVANLTLAAMMGFSIWGKGLMRLFGTLLGLVLGLAVAFPAGLISPPALAHIRQAPLVALPHISHISYSFDITLALPFLVAALAAALRTIGVVTTCQQLNDPEWQQPDMTSIRGGVLADGLGCALGGLLGVVGMSSSPSAVGAARATGATSRVIAGAVGVWFVVLAGVPKLAAIFLALPPAVVGAALIFTGSLLVVGGIQIMARTTLDLRKTFIIGVPLLLALSHQVFPAYYRSLPQWLKLFAGSSLSIATLLAVGLNLAFRLGLRRRFEMTITLTGELGGPVTKLRQVLQEWEVTTAAADRAVATLRQICRHLRDHQTSEGPVRLRAVYDEVDLSLDLAYQGSLSGLSLSGPRGSGEADRLPFSEGMSASWQCLCPDQGVCSQDGAQCRIHLVF